MMIYKGRLSTSLEMLDIIINLDSTFEEIKAFVEE